jgi:hypothetical protein
MLANESFVDAGGTLAVTDMGRWREKNDETEMSATLDASVEARRRTF